MQAFLGPQKIHAGNPGAQEQTALRLYFGCNLDMEVARLWGFEGSGVRGLPYTHLPKPVLPNKNKLFQQGVFTCCKADVGRRSWCMAECGLR